jgi:hypothetical protein
MFGLQKRFFAFLLSLGVCLFFSQQTAFARIDIVFDIDHTLVIGRENPSPDTIIIGIEFYEPLEGATVLLQELAENPQARLSAFSGGEQQRNTTLFEKMLLPNGKPTNSVLYRIRSGHELTNGQKDLRTVETDIVLENTILVDDIAKFAFTGQEENLLLVERTSNRLVAVGKILKEVLVLHETKGLSAREALAQVLSARCKEPLK